MTYNNLLVEKDGPVVILTLNRPEARNALCLELMQELNHCLGVIEADRDVRALVLTGGPSHFCAGFDLPMAISLADNLLRIQMVQTCNELFLKILKFRTPVIAAVSGFALAAGFDLQVMADIRIYSETARVGQVEINVAVTPLVDPLWKIVGSGIMKELVMTGKVYGAEEAYRIGLANHVYPVDTFIKEAISLAHQLAKKEPHVLQTIKEQTNRIPGMEVEQAVRSQLHTFQTFVGQQPMIDRMQAILNKESKNNQ
ncbi:MAG: enoyl-CoA hydratase/isomerase family protein [Chitinophagales bacterium]